jgi:hypothetical protein
MINKRRSARKTISTRVLVNVALAGG